MLPGRDQPVRGERVRGSGSGIGPPVGRSPSRVPELRPVPGSTDPSMGAGPGALEPSMLAPETGLIGGRRRVGRIPRAKGNRQVSPAAAMAQAPAMRLPAALPTTDGDTGTKPRGQAVRGLASAIEDEGPTDGLTLDAAIEQMLAANLDLLALKYEIPQADADILTASLRANPLIYLDSQFIPYGSFNNQRPGGPSQYDVNITYPLDLTHKRQARMRVARAAKTVLEAQFQDVIRRQIGNVYRAFIDLQSARLNVLTAQASVKEQERVVAAARRRAAADKAEVDAAAERFSIVLEKAQASLVEARDSLNDAQESLAVLINAPPEQTSLLQPRGTLRDIAPPAPPLEELTRLALESRPDVVAARRGIGRAQAELGLQRANRLDDVFVFYDPYTFQATRPQGSTSWIAAVAFPFPIYNRNQGNIARAHSNIHQTQTELAALERRVISEVRIADREYRSSLKAVTQIEKSTLPHARQILERNTREFEAGKITPDDYLGHLDDEAEAARGFRDALIRHRRSMLDLNTAVGVRILP